jgi:hypothetical protein
MLIGVNVPIGNESATVANEASKPLQSDFDASFRRSCAASVRRNYSAAGSNAPLAQIERYCECALATFKETDSETIAAQTCNERANDGTLEFPIQNVDAFYSSDIPRQRVADTGTNPLRAFGRMLGSISAIALGVACFVGGLLGWLLVMRKRVLQCDLCGAVVNAS